MQKIKYLLISILCIAAIMMLMGCNILDNLIKEGEGNAPLAELLNRGDNNDDGVPVITAPEGEQTIKLYFAGKNGNTLVEQNRTIPKTLSLARETVNQWLLGPVGDSDCFPVVSPDTRLRDISITNGIATVDLSKEYLEPYGNVTAETALYGLVNTVAQFPSVQLVRIRVEGQDIKVFRGINLNELRFREDLVGYSSGPVIPEDQVSISIGENSEEDPAPEVNKTLSPSSKNIFY